MVGVFIITNWHKAANATAVIAAMDHDHAEEQLRKWIKNDCCPAYPPEEWQIQEVEMRGGADVTVIME
jgi:hypothetical protein